MADNNKKKYIKYEDTTYELVDSRIPDPGADDNGKVLGIVNGAYVLKQEQGGGTGLSDDAKAALLACFSNVAWVGSDGQSYYDDLYDALYPPAPPATLLSISAVFNQGGHAVYDTDTLGSLKQYLAVTAHYDNGTSQTVTNYTLSGTLTVGTSTITVSYGGKTTTFNVTVTQDAMSGYTKYDYIKNTVVAASSSATGSAFSLGFGQEYSSPEYEHEIDVVLESVFSTSSPVCGLRNASGTLANARNIWCNNQNGATGKLAATFSEQDTGFTIGANLNEHYVIKTTVENGNAVIYCNNVLASTHSVVSGFTASGNFILFGSTTAGNVQSIRSTVKVYGYKVKNISTGTLVCDFVPCTDSQGNPGVFDRVRNHFYTHSDPQNYLAVGNDAG